MKEHPAAFAAGCSILQKMVMGDNILISAVFHEKATGNDAKLHKAQLFIELQSPVVICHYGVEL